MPSRSDSPGSHKQPTGLFGSLRRREARSLGGHAPSGSFACLASPFMDWRGACGRRRRRRTRGSKSPFVRGARFAVLREEGMGYLVAILSRGRAPQVVILSGAPPGAESKDPVWRQQKAPPSSTPRTRDRPPGSATEKHRPHPALAEIARYARFFRVTSPSSRRNRWSASAIRAQNRA